MKEDQLRQLKWEFQESRDRKTSWLHKRWRTILNEYKTNDFDSLFETLTDQVNVGVEAGADAVDTRLPIVNIIVRRLVALLSIKNPEFSIENVSPRDEAIAWLLETEFNSLMHRHLKFNKTGRRLILEAALLGTGIAKVGFESEFVYDLPAYAERRPRGARDVFGEELFPDGTMTEYTNVTVKQGKPVFRSVRAQDMFFDPGARVLDEVRRYYHRSMRPLIDIQKDMRYKPKARREISGVSVTDWDRQHTTYPTGRNHGHSNPEQRMAEVIECFDVASRQYCVFSMETQTPLRDWAPFPFQGVDTPYTFLQPIEDPDGPWGFPYALLFTGAARGYNIIKAHTVDSVGRDGKTVFLGDENVEDPYYDAFNRARHGELVKWRDPENNPIVPVNFGGASPEMLKLKAEFREDIHYASGLTDPSRGEPSDGSKTATETAIRQEQQAIAIEDIRYIVEQFYEDVGADLLKILLQRWPDEEIVKVVGNDVRQYFWIPVERERVLRDFRLNISVGSTEKVDKATERRQIVELVPRIVELTHMIDQENYNVAGGFPPSPIDKLELLKLTLESFDPRLKERVLRQKDPVKLLMRLVKEHGMMPIEVSPDLKEEIQRIIQANNGQAMPHEPTQMPGYKADFEERNRVPAPYAGPADQQTAGAQVGRGHSQERQPGSAAV